jgi:hypothetical protein
VKLLVVSDPKGRVVHVGPLWWGRTADITMFREEFGGLSFAGKRVYFDLGFCGLDAAQLGSIPIIPHKKPRGGELTRLQKLDNRALSPERVVVENAIAGAKHFFVTTTENRFRDRKKTHGCFCLCVGLSNLKGNKRK